MIAITKNYPLATDLIEQSVCGKAQHGDAGALTSRVS